MSGIFNVLRPARLFLNHAHAIAPMLLAKLVSREQELHKMYTHLGHIFLFFYLTFTTAELSIPLS
jgi:hypothetical protein